jgi:hypothetical protein
LSATTFEIRRRDPAVIAGRAHAVLDSAARVHGQWPDEGQEVIGRAFISLHVALEKYRLAADTEGDASAAAEDASLAMALLLISVSVFLGKAVADQMMTTAAEVAR